MCTTDNENVGLSPMILSAGQTFSLKTDNEADLELVNGYVVQLIRGYKGKQDTPDAEWKFEFWHYIERWEVQRGQVLNHDSDNYFFSGSNSDEQNGQYGQQGFAWFMTDEEIGDTLNGPAHPLSRGAESVDITEMLEADALFWVDAIPANAIQREISSTWQNVQNGKFIQRDDDFLPKEWASPLEFSFQYNANR